MKNNNDKTKLDEQLEEIEKDINDIAAYDYSASTMGIMDKIKQLIQQREREAYNDGLENGWKLSNNNIKELIKPWFRGVHNIKLPKYLSEQKPEEGDNV